MKVYAYAVAMGLIWAQQGVELLKLPQPRPIRQARPLYLPVQMRTQSLGWLLPNQDFAIVPSPTNDPDYAGDTLISNGVGPNTRSNPPAQCLGAFFDSLETALAYAIVGNERFKFEGSGIQSLGIALYYDGAIAERYDFSPDLGGTDRTISIKGIAALLYNLSQTTSNPCNPSLATPVPDSLNDGAYTFFYAVYPARSYTWGAPFYSQSRPGTIPGSTPVRLASKPLSNIRLANGFEGDMGPRCPMPGSASSFSITEFFDFVYFSTPLDITDSASYYLSVGTERYNINTYTLTDTIYFFYGPAFNGVLSNHPCLNGDTTRIGRSLFSWAFYDTTSAGGDFYSNPSSLAPVFPDWVPMHAVSPPSLKGGLNWVLFPIVYEHTLSMGSWIRGDAWSVMTPYPNPSTECFHVRFEAPKPTEVRGSLYTMEGRLVKSWPARSLSAGVVETLWDVADVPAGSYLFRLDSELGRAAFHVTILH
ncbi:MAG: T9SS type A sorting domain-containing protein [Bacteroidia bacterium]|nr:T9SS type A sorting domain-containing protein [Bacteroidia bacterium]